ncbi:hypothetical protein [Sphingomonas daechungensis]|uniref:hypothetical protein n=1 Tax=Sphingomonas daechungensis TaxID=1176646 RepID=UPI003783A13E
MTRNTVCIPLAALVLLAGCKTNDVTDGVRSAGSAVADGAQSAVGAGVSLVNVDLRNVLNDLALDLKIDRSNIPINAQIPITVAANVCGVSINILSIGGGGSSQGCTATTSSPELAQAVQQQLAANGSVGGGAQTTTSAQGTSGSGTTTTPPQQQPTTQPPQ